MTGEMVPMHEAAKLAGVSTTTLRRRAAAGELPVYASSLNRREKLIRLEDLNRYGEPRPIIQPSSSDNGDRESFAN